MATLAKKRGGGGVSSATSKSSADTAPAWENPLIPNKKLCALYTAMAELRLLESHIARQRVKASARIHTAPGEEGCRASTILNLEPGDLTSDPHRTVSTSFLRGSKLRGLLDAAPASELPTFDDTVARLHLALGAALAIKSANPTRLVLAYVHNGDLMLAQWKPILRLAATSVAPVIFVVLPSDDSAIKPGQLSLAASTCGVPGIPVDASDPVALYRVAQESLLRTRSGGGPVLIESIPFHLPGSKSPPADPIVTMKQSLLHRRIVDEKWLRQVESRFSKRLAAGALVPGH